MNPVLISYPLKQSTPVQFADVLVLSLEETYNSETAFTFRPLLGKINQLRNKVVSQTSAAQLSDQEIDKSIQIISAYIKYATILLKRFNWNSEKGKSINGVLFRWMDSFQKNVESTKNTIAFDIFCCYYNLAVLYFMRALKLSQVDLDNSRKEAISKARAAAYILRQMTTKYQSLFSNCGFHDTQPAHLAMLENLSLGLIYKCVYETLKSNQYKVGINKVASIASVANKHFYKAFGIGSGYFTKQPSGISENIKTELLSMAFVESLYFDVITNVKLAKYYSNIVEKDHAKFPLVIGYQKKAYRIIQVGFSNTNVQQLFNLNPHKKKQLLAIRDDLRETINKDLQRNNHIYKQQQISEQNLPSAEQIPQQFNVSLNPPANLIMQNQGEFSKLMSAESSQLAMELSNFAKSRKSMLQGSFKKLNDEVSKVFTETGINFYLDDDSTIQSVPQSVKSKISDINSLGGKYKLEQYIKQITQNPQTAVQALNQLRVKLQKEEAWDQEKRMAYREKWVRPSSSSLNSEYYKKIQILQSKLKMAAPVDQKVIAKYKKHLIYISILDQPDQQISLVLPKIQKIQNPQNLPHITRIKEIIQKIKLYAEQVDEVTKSISEYLQKSNYAMIASESIGKQKSKEQVFKETFAPLQSKIGQFNMQCKIIKEQTQQAASIALYLNTNSKNMHSSKLQHQGVLVSFNEIISLFNNLQQSTTFYDKMGDHILRIKNDVQEYVDNRAVSGKELEDKIRGKGEPGGGTSKIIQLPSIYPQENQIDFNIFGLDPVLGTEEKKGQTEDASKNAQNTFDYQTPVAPQTPFDEFCKSLTPDFLQSLNLKKQ